MCLIVPRFGSSGIRGLGNVDVTPELALKVGMVIGDLYGDTVIGRDPRLTGSMLDAALSAGVLSSGSDAIEACLVSTPTLARGAGNYACGVVIHAQPDGHFPGAEPEPTEENLAALRATVRACRADLGIAHDGDGDRMVAVDREGTFVGGDLLLALFARQEVRTGLVVPVDASMVLEDLLPKAKIWRTRVGDVYVAAEIKRRNADFGGEPSGTWIFPRATLCPDGVYAAARLVSMVAERPLDELVGEIPRYPVIRGAVAYSTEGRAKVESRLDASLRGLSADLSTVDGWRLQFEDGWALVRFSGTEPKIRVLAESRNEARAKEIYSTVLSSTRGAAA